VKKLFQILFDGVSTKIKTKKTPGLHQVGLLHEVLAEDKTLSGKRPDSFPKILLYKIALPEPVLKYFSKLLACDSD